MKYEVNRNILKCEFVRYAPSEISTINTAISQVYIKIPREDSIMPLLLSYIALNLDVLYAASNDRYADGNDIWLVNLGPIALFSNYKFTTTSGKHLEDITHAHIVLVMYKLITSSKDSEDLSNGFEKDRKRRQRQLSVNKNLKGNFNHKNMLEDKLGFAEKQEKDTFGYKLTFKRNTDKSVWIKAEATIVGKIKINDIEAYVEHYSPSIPQQAILFKQYLNRTPTEFQYVKISVSTKEVKTQNRWTFKLGTQEGINVPIWIFVRFQQKERQDSQNLNIFISYRPPITSAQCIIGIGKYLHSGILLNYDDDD